MAAINEDFLVKLEDSLLDIVVEEIERIGTFNSHTAFALQAFGNDAKNYQSKWSRIRRRETRISISDLYRIGSVLNRSPITLLALAENRAQIISKS